MLCFGWGSGWVLSAVGYPDLWLDLLAVVGLGGGVVVQHFAREENVDAQQSL